MISITEKEFNQLADYIRKNYGINLSLDKKTLVKNRLSGIWNEKNFNEFSDYYKYITNDKSGKAVSQLIDKITTNHTFFMREAEHFEHFKNEVLPYLYKNVKDKDLRIWCAASSTGEEAYTLAIIIDEFLGNEKIFWDTKLLATDISTKVLNIASKGIYSNERVAPLPQQWKVNYFNKYDEGNWILKDKIRNEVVYRKFNLMDNLYPFKKRFHTIFCRNVMIYFDSETIINLVNKLYNCMEIGGYLYIGHSESLNREKIKFKYVMPSVYRKE